MTFSPREGNKPWYGDTGLTALRGRRFWLFDQLRVHSKNWDPEDACRCPRADFEVTKTQ
jgi:hypothetical protein